MISGATLVALAGFVWFDGVAHSRSAASEFDRIKDLAIPSEDQLTWSEWLKADYQRALFSHVAIPFPADDAWYGDGRSPSPGQISLGNLNVRGEKNLLNVSPAQILRLRYNPFYDYQAQRITDLLAELR